MVRNYVEREENREEKIAKFYICRYLLLSF